MSDIYLWYAMMPNVNPTAYASPEAYLEAVRYKTLDSHFSYITSRAANDAFYSDSQFIGFGLSTSLNGSEMRVLQVFPDSPALEAGLSRGDRIVEIGGRTVESLVASGEIDSAFGPSDIGVETNIAFNQAGARRDAHMVKRLVTIPTVSLTQDLQRRRTPGRLHLLPQLRHARRSTRSTRPSRSCQPPASTISCSISATTAAGS